MNTISKPTISKRGKTKYHQGKFKPKNPFKVIGNPNNIIYRSKWELCFLKWLDTTPNVIRYASEEVIILYRLPTDGKIHKYFMDFYMEVRQPTGIIKKFLIEIKPFSQTIMPKAPKNGVLTESYQNDIKTYIKNQAKWDAARSVCLQKGWEFCILTEKELFKKGPSTNVRRNKHK
jgi:hypothetical protein